MKDVQRAMATLAFSPNTTCPTYKARLVFAWHRTILELRICILVVCKIMKCTCYDSQALFDDARWNDLRRQFRHDNFVLHSLSTQSLLSVTLQAGLSAFKTKYSG